MGGKRALVTGAYGIVGLNAVEELRARDDWDLVAVGRRDTAPLPDMDYLRADLMDAEATREALGGARDCTHLFFGAFQYAADPYEESAINVAMLRNTLDALRAHGAPIEHVVICEGSKAYGALIGPMRTPAKERDPRVPGPLYYYDQEDLLFARGAEQGFGTTVLRPDFIAGIGLGRYTNLVTAVAVYASICKAVSLPLYFPGSPESFATLFQMTDARLLARGMIWAAETGGRDNAIYNITNGDLFRWSNSWARVADFFGLDPAHPLNFDLASFMRDKREIWARLMKEHDLALGVDEMINWAHGGVLKLRYEIHTSTIRIRQAGFHECLDSEDRLIALFEQMRVRRLIP